MLETLLLLESRKQDYSGIARLGIEALELKIKGSSIKEIAQITSSLEATVKSRLFAAKNRLRKALAEEHTQRKGELVYEKR